MSNGSNRPRRGRWLMVTLALVVSAVALQMSSGIGSAAAVCPRGGTLVSHQVPTCTLTLTGNQTKANITAHATFTLADNVAGSLKLTLVTYTRPDPGLTVTYPQAMFATQSVTLTAGQSGALNVAVPHCGAYQIDLVVGDALDAIPSAADGYAAQHRLLGSMIGPGPNSEVACGCPPPTETPMTLWPPNHKFRLFTVPGGVTITGVTQDEALNDLGDGNTQPDAMWGPTSDSVYLRAERSGLGDGRVYRVNYTGANQCTGTVLVGVPHDQGNGSTPIDSGLVVDSFGN